MPATTTWTSSTIRPRSPIPNRSRRSAKLREHDEHAQSPAPGSAGREVLLVGRIRFGFFLVLALATVVRAESEGAQPPAKAHRGQAGGAPRKPQSEKPEKRDKPAEPARPAKPTKPAKPKEASAVERRLSEAARLNPESFDAQYQLASFYLQQGQLQAALPHLVRARAIDPSNYECGHDLALALLETGKLDEARAQIALMMDAKETAELHNLLGNVEESAGNFIAAAEENQRATLLVPNAEKLIACRNN